MALLNFAGSPHGGSLKLLPEWDSQPKITPTQILDHTIVGTALGAWWYFHDSTGIESHFIIRGRRSGDADGHIWQLMDTGREADANLQANDKAISIETEDNGARPIEPWSQAQLDSLVWLHNKLVAIHPSIKRQNATSCTRAGLGYHSQLGAPSCRTPSAGKDCPAPARIGQWSMRLLPAFLDPTTEEDLTIMDDATREYLDKQFELTRIGDVAGDAGDTHDSTSLEGVGRQVQAVDGLVRKALYGVTRGEADTHDTLSIEGVHRRIDTLEAKLDQLLAALPPPPPPGP